MRVNSTKLLEYACQSLSQPVFCIAFKLPEGAGWSYRSCAGYEISPKDPDRSLLMTYAEAEAAAKAHQDHGRDAFIGVRYRSGNTRGWFQIPAGINLQIQSQAKPFTPFADGKAPSIAFPINSLPEPYKAYVQAASGSYQVDAAMVSCCVLGVLSAIFQRCGFSIRINPDWEESPNIYLMVTASPSERKSPVLRDASAPLMDGIEAWNERQAELIDWQKKKIEVLKKKVDNATTKLSKGLKQASEEELRQAQAELREAEQDQLTPQKWLVDDTTPEALALVLRDNQESAALLSGEGGSILGILAGRYSAPGVGANLDLFLKGYSVEPSNTIRVGRQEVALKRPRLTVLLMTQPSLQQEFVNNPAFGGRGLCARFLYSFPKSLVGERSFYSDPVPEDIRREYKSHIKQITEMALDWEQQESTLTVSDDAQRVLAQFHEELEPTLKDMSEAAQEWNGKLKGNITRIAALLYLAAHDGQAGEIDEKTMQGAVEIGKYFKVMSEYALGCSQDSPARKDALLILQKLKSPSFKQYRDNGYISKRDLYLKMRGKPFRSSPDMDAGLKELSDNGYIIITQDELKEAGNPGRPSPKIFYSQGFLEALSEG